MKKTKKKIELTKNQARLLHKIVAGEHITCLHILGQDLADEMSAIIRALDSANQIKVTDVFISD